MRTNSLLLTALLASACRTEATEATAERAAPEHRTAASGATLEAARAEFDAGRPLDALAVLDDVLKARPEDLEVWLARGETLLAAAEAQREGSFYTDALAAYEKALALGAPTSALFGASKAARGDLDGAKALEYAQRALAANAQPNTQELRIAIEAAFTAYVERKRAGEDAPALFGTTEELLLRALERDRKDPWALEQLGYLYQWEGRNDGALEIFAQAIEVDPDASPLHDRFIELKRSLEGPESVAEHYESLHARHPGSAYAPWRAGVERFELGLAALANSAAAVESLTRAEQLFAASRKLQPDFTQSCLGYEVICRAGIGWAELAAGALERAERAFLSMEELFPGGLEWQIEGRVQSGVIGLQYVADRALRSGADYLGGFEIGAAARAAQIYARLHAYRPSDGDIANNCGFFHREWGVGMVFKSREYAAQAAQASDPAVRDLDAALAGQAAEAARSILRACRDAYLDSARLAPADVRVVNDAALILVYHFPSQHELAEQLLMQCVALGAQQKDDPDLGDGERSTLLEAWGDAHQNLGVLELLVRGNPAKAREWFDKTVAIGPQPRVAREWVSQVALPMCEAAARGVAVDALALDPRIFVVE